MSEAEAQSYTPLQDLIAELETLCREGSTGTVFIATDDNRLARLSLTDGEIDFISFHNKRGSDALALMPNIQAGRFRFDEGHKSALGGGSLPPTAEILKFLHEPQAAPTPAPSPSSDSEAAPQGVTAEQRQTIEETLAEFVGPMASIVCDEHLNQATDLNAALRKLSAEIQDAGQAQDFLAQVRERLSNAD